MYIIMPSPQTLKMSPGKMAAQAAHAAVEAYRISDHNSQAVNRWDCGGHYKKIVLMTDDLRTARDYIEERGFRTVPIIDEGHTELSSDLTFTAVGVEILDKDNLHVRETFSAFKLWSAPDPAELQRLKEHFSQPWPAYPTPEPPKRTSVFVGWKDLFRRK